MSQIDAKTSHCCTLGTHKWHIWDTLGTHGWHISWLIEKLKPLTVYRDGEICEVENTLLVLSTALLCTIPLRFYDAFLCVYWTIVVCFFSWSSFVHFLPISPFQQLSVFGCSIFESSLVRFWQFTSQFLAIFGCFLVI